jgi:CDP-glycerol glycerophosphotransferase
LDLEVMRRALADDTFLLIRTHYLDRYSLSARYHPFAADVSRHHDVTELMLVTDVLVTDYSSVMFDFANTGKPMVFYTYDYEDYVRDERGTYLDLPDVAPGPMAEDTEGLIAALRAVDTDRERWSERYAAFRKRFCEYETGHAADDVLERFFARREGG